MILTYFLITLTVILIGSLIVFKKTRKLISDETPDSFFKLESSKRKLALDLAWEPLAVFKRTISEKPFKYIAYIIISVFLFSIGLFFMYAATSGLNDEPVPFFIFSVILTQVSCIIFFYSIYKYTKIDQEAYIKKRYLLDLQKLSVKMIEENFKNWFQAVIEKTKNISVNENNLQPMQQYMMLDEGNLYTPNGLPSKVINVAYIFLNGYISVVNNIQFMIEDISYSLVDSDIPTLIHNPSNKWSTEEYHFKDIVEVNYNTEPIKATNSLSNFENTIDGFLTLTLSNGSIKQYPTSKKHIDSFLNIARERVRNLKTLG